MHRRRGLAPTVQTLASRQFPSLRRLNRINDRRRNCQGPDDVVIEDPQAARRDCPHGHFLVARDAQLAHQEGIQRRTKCGSNLLSDRHSASR